MCAVVSAASLLEVFLPGPCPGCGDPLPGADSGLCSECLSRLVPISGPRCPRCGGPTDQSEQGCLACDSQPPPYSGAVFWGEYDGVLRTVLLAMKHGGHDELARPLAARLAARVSLEPWIEDVNMITAVPSHPLHRLRRGFAAAELLTREIAGPLGLSFAAVLRRHGLGRQMGRTRIQRRALGRNRFSVRRGADIGKRRILLVDDVSTTGTTISRAAQVLLHAGAAEVFAAVLAWAPETRRMA